LPVDLQQHVLAGRQLRLDRLPRGALPVAMDASVLEEVASLDHALERRFIDEVVVLGMALARSRRARGERDRQADVGVAREYRVDQAGFPGARGRGDDIEGSAHAHSMFCTCSRTWSISTLSSTAEAELRASTDLEPSVLASRLNSCSRKSSEGPIA